MKFLFQNRRFFLGLTILATLVFGYFLPNVLPVDFNFENFFPKDDEYAFYREYRETFGATDNAIFVAFESGEKGIFDRGFLLEIDSLLEVVSGFEHVDSVVSPATLPYVLRGAMEMKRENMLDLNDQNSVENTRKRLETDPFLRDIFISKDSNYLGALVLLNPEILNLPIRSPLCIRIQDALLGAQGKVFISGTPYLRSMLVEKIRTELILFLGSSYLLILGFLIFIYRSFWGVLIPIIGVVGSVVWCLGLMGIFGNKIDIVNNLLPPIMFVVGMADIIHMTTKYTQELRLGKSKEEAMKATLAKIGSAILLTSITTAVGFASLATSAMVPMRNFGLFAAAGVMFAYLIAIVLIPNALMRIPKEKLINSKGMGEFRFWDSLLKKTYRIAHGFPRSIALVFCGVTLFSGIGMSLISLDGYLVDDLRPGDPIFQNLDFFQDNFNGIRPFELAIMTKGDKEITDLDVLKDIEKIENFLHEREQFSPLLSPVSLFKGANRITRFNLNKHYKLPRSEEKVQEVLGMIYSSGNTKLYNSILSEDLRMGRVSGQMNDIGTVKFAVLQEDLRKFFETECDTNQISYRLTGNAFIYSRNVTYLQKGVFYGLGLAFLIIGLLMGGIFKSLKMVLIALIPNVIPLLFAAGLMGILGIGLTATTSVVFVISFGISVDVTIHFLSRFRIEMKENSSLDQAIKETLLGTGKALILTSIIIISGFVLFLFSNLGGTFAIGLLVTVTLITSLVSNLLLMPVICRWAYKNQVLEPKA